MHSEKFGIIGYITSEESIKDYPPFVTLDSKTCSCTIALHGAHLLSFKKQGGEDILWLSEHAKYEKNKAIRGGIPLCFPWFASENSPAHGFARLMVWDVVRSGVDEDGNPHMTLRLEASAESKKLWEYDFIADIEVSLSDKLSIKWHIQNSDKEPFSVTQALHSYFHISDVQDTLLRGLEGSAYHDSLDGSKQKRQEGAIMIGEEVDRIYHSQETCIIEDKGFSRKIVIEKEGSADTVVWNPWIDKSSKMDDFTVGGHREMLCVESANVGENRWIIAAGETKTMQLTISEEKL